jgi:hypothetical protein
VPLRRALSSDSRGIKAAVDVVVGYQQRSDALLVRVLGSSYSMVDVGFYGGGALAALAAGLTRATAGARAPILVLWGGTLLMERLALERLHDLLDVDERGEVRTCATGGARAWGAPPLRGDASHMPCAGLASERSPIPAGSRSE